MKAARLRRRLVLLWLPLLAAGCERPQSALMPRADQAEAIDHVWQVMAWTCTAIYLAVLVALAWAVVRRRRAVHREGLAADGGLEKALVAWSVFIVVVLSVFVTLSFLEDRRIRGSDSDLEVRITAKQWWWQVEYLDEDPTRQFVTANELHLPRDRIARIELRSADVIHSFWVPALGGKEDLIPGRTNAVYATPRRAGVYRGQCAEFCGLQHAHMALDVVVRDPAQFARWRADQMRAASAPATARAARGRQVFEQYACASCHTIRGTAAHGRTGPDLTHVASRRRVAAGRLPVDASAMAAWIADPQHFKPGNQMPAVRLAPDELGAVVDYLLELE
jgi:cytochrome c oxidase subunit 2